MLRIPRIPSKMRYALVVTVILLGCAGLLVPSVARVREAASRSTCLDHLKQLSVAIHNYASSNQDRLPVGTVPNATLPAERRLSWYVSILPYVEQDKAFKLIDLSTAADDERNRIPTGLRFRNFCCPSSGELKVRNGGVYDPDTGAFIYPVGDRAWKSPTPVTHYVGVAGVGEYAALLPTGHPRAGVFGYEGRYTIVNIPDGTSNTLLVMETGLNPGHWAYGGPSTVRGIEPGMEPYFGEGRPFGGFHSSRASVFEGWNRHGIIAMCDASTRTIGNSIDPTVLAALATAAGKEELPPGW